MKTHREIKEALTKLTLHNRESAFHHHSFDEDLLQYEMMKRGDIRSVSEGKRMFEGPLTGSVSDDPLTNYKYLFVASVTLACRYCIEGGMDTEMAFNLSDLYIRRMDKLRTIPAIFDLRSEMIRDYTIRMQTVLKGTYSRPVQQIIRYIDQNLLQPITVKGISKEIGLSQNYLSTLFQKETGSTISEYIRRKRIDCATLLLQYTDFNCLDIAEYLCFASDSHFSAIFKKIMGMTPREYRKTHHEKSSVFRFDEETSS